MYLTGFFFYNMSQNLDSVQTIVFQVLPLQVHGLPQQGISLGYNGGLS